MLKKILLVFAILLWFSCSKENNNDNGNKVSISKSTEEISSVSVTKNPPQQQPSYKVYDAVLNQSGINDPTAIELQNTLGNIVWTRVGAGTYDGFLLHGFPIGKTFVVMGGTGILETIYLNQNDDSRVTISLNIPSDFSGQDDRLRYTAIEIRVYP